MTAIKEKICRQGLCIGCGLCAAMCPKQAIEVQWGKNLTWAPVTDAAKCTNCGLCGRICPNTPECICKYASAVAVNVTDYTADTQGKRAFVAGLCEHLIRDYGLKVIMVSHDVTDYFNLNIISDMIDNWLKSSVIVPDTRQWQGAMLKKLISCCRLAVGGRYHFIVFAGSSNTPFMGMAGNHYSYIKQDGFARAVGLEDFILTEKETWDMPVVKSKIKNAMELKLDIADKFQRPSVSMQHFGSWIRLNNNHAK